MKKNITHILLSALLLTVSSASVAKANAEGWYVDGSGGLAFTSDTKTSDASVNFEQKYKTGGTGHLAVGYYMDEWRFAFEGGYFRRNLDKNKNKTTGVNIAGASGSLTHLTFMGNVFYDVPVMEGIEWYVGGGLGLAIVKLDTKPAGAVGNIKGNDTTFAFQWLTGFNFDLDDMWQFTLGYRGLTHSNTKHDVISVGTTVQKDKKVNSPVVSVVEAGFRYKF